MILTSFSDSPVGSLYLGANESGICFLEFTQVNSFEEQKNRLIRKLKDDFSEGQNKHLDDLNLQLDEYFSEKRKIFDLNFVLTGTEFQKKVWMSLLDIPYGETRTYKQQAEYLAKPFAVRAVANANGANLISIVIPCHRVIGSDGSLTGYGGGLMKKKWLLELENKDY
jgi:AraC family transcriptional regulator of adaptative response/methylated-DNA-[protein]-cysteine methyltransferase